MTTRAVTGAGGVLVPASAATEQVSAPEADFRTGLVQAWQLDAWEVAPSNTAPELQVLVTDEQGRYATAFGRVSLADGTSAQSQFVFSLDPGAQSPCLGEVRAG